MPIQNAFNNTLVADLRVSLGSDATGDVYFRNSSGFFSRLGVGASGQVLTVVSGLPAWSTGAPPIGNAGGDLTGTYPNPTIANSSVTFGKFQNINSQTFLGRNTAGSGTVEALTVANLQAMLTLGTAAYANTGTGNGNVPVLDSSGKLNTSVLPSITINQTYIVANQTARLALSANVGDIAKQTDNGLAYILQATPATTDANWISIGDTTITAGDIVSGTIATARLGSGTADSTTILFGDQTYKAVPFVQMPSSEVTGTTANLAVNTSYRANNAALVTLTLPTTAAVDSIIRVVGVGAGGWRIAQNANQMIHFGNQSTTTGISGRLDSTHRRDVVEVMCVAANTEFQVIAAIGNINLT